MPVSGHARPPVSTVRLSHLSARSAGAPDDHQHLDTAHRPITDAAYVASCRARLDRDCARVLQGFVRAEVIRHIVAESAPREAQSGYADKSYNVYLTPVDPDLAPEHLYKHQVRRSQGPIADDQIAADSALREI